MTESGGWSGSRLRNAVSHAFFANADDDGTMVCEDFLAQVKLLRYEDAAWFAMDRACNRPLVSAWNGDCSVRASDRRLIWSKDMRRPA